jgi:predicted nucleic acid-binding protein
VEDQAGEILSFLLDTDVISQLAKDEPNAAVVEWLATCKDTPLYLSVVTIEEIREGIELMPAGKKRARLDRWLRDELLADYADRILPVTVEIADLCGRILGSKATRAFHPDVSDAYIAATARVHGLKVATLNRKHFEKLGVELAKF